VEPLLEPPTGVAHHHIPTHDGGTVHVVEKGSGTPLVLLHGVTLQWWVWSPLFHLLAEDHRVIAWDMRGHGESVAGDDGVTLPAAATDLATVLSEMDLAPSVVVGHSMGGMTLGRFLAAHPGVRDRRVAEAVFLTTNDQLLPLATATGYEIAHTAVMRATLGGLSRPGPRPRGPEQLTRVVNRLAFGRHYSGRAVDQLGEMMAATSPTTLTEAAATLSEHDVIELLSDVPTPATVVTGSRDLLTPPHHGRALAEALPRGRFELLADTGHQVMQEVPHRLAQILDPLLRQADLVAER
jgi:pimeloyl-ACP methyl ester carboxylesterase